MIKVYDVVSRVEREFDLDAVLTMLQHHFPAADLERAVEEALGEPERYWMYLLPSNLAGVVRDAYDLDDSNFVSVLTEIQRVGGILVIPVSGMLEAMYKAVVVDGCRL